MQGVLLNEYVFKLKVKLGTFYDGRNPCVFRQEDSSPPRVACTIVKAEKVNAAPWMAKFLTLSGSAGSTAKNDGARRKLARKVTFKL